MKTAINYTPSLLLQAIMLRMLLIYLTNLVSNQHEKQHSING